MIVVIYDKKMYENKKLIRTLACDSCKELHTFTFVGDCLDFMKRVRTDILFVSLCSGEEEYIPLIEFVKNSNLKTVVCLIGNSEEQILDVYKYKCDYFLQKTYEDRELTRCIETLDLLVGRIKHIKIITFGNFEVFINDVPVVFHNAKAKELFALCVDHHGGLVSIFEASDKLWPHKLFDEKVKRLYRKAVMAINRTLKEYGAENIFESVRGGCRVNPTSIKCDYYSFLKNPEQNIMLLNGKYMYEYEWAEDTLASIIRLAQSISGDKILDFLY